LNWKRFHQIGLRGVAEDRVVELEEVPPAGGGEQPQAEQGAVPEASPPRRQTLPAREGEARHEKQGAGGGQQGLDGVHLLGGEQGAVGRKGHRGQGEQ
jgi:hypothetical protein